jgi:hypothetical protein
VNRDPEEPRALVGSGAPVPPRQPHDPTHPGVAGRVPPARIEPGSTAAPARLPAPPAQPTPPPLPPAPSTEPATTRFGIAKDALRNAVSGMAGGRPAPQPESADDAPATTAFGVPGRAKRAAGTDGPNGNREIESWLGELRSGTPAPPPNGPRPSATQDTSTPPTQAFSAPPTQAIPTPGAPADAGNAPTTAFRAQSQPDATEKIDTREGEKGKRRGGGVSAQDLLRREGRL